MNPKLATGEVEILAREIRLLNEAKTPPFQIAEDGAGLGGRPAALPLSRPAAAAAAAQHRAAPPRVDGDPPYFDANGFWEIETPILAEVDAGRRARLPGAEPRAPGRVLRAAAVAADLQADPDDRRHRPLLSDRALLPRRGPARRSAARVHAGRRRDVVRAAGDDLRPDRAADAGDLQGDRPRRDDCRSAACRTPRRSRATARTSRTCAAGWRSHDLSEVFRDSEFRVFKQIVADGGVVRGFAVPRRQQVLAQPARRASSTRRSRWASPA